jgi:polyferredoxin
MKKETNYRSWSFRFLIYILLLNVLIIYLTITLIDLDSHIENYYIRMLVLSAMIWFLLIAGVVLTILSVKNKEKKDYKFHLSVYGYPAYTILNILVSFLQ